MTELKRIAATKQRINKEADQLATECAKMEIQFKGRIEQKGHTTKNQLLAEQAETICTTVAEMKVPWRMGKKYIMAGEISDDQHA